MKRVLAAITAVALMSFAPLALTSSASAAPDTAGSYGSSSNVEQEFAQEAKRKLAFYGKRRGGNNFFVAGRVTPGYKNSKVFIQRAICRGNGCNSPNFKRFKQTKTNGQGRFRTPIATPGAVGTTFRYRLVVPKRGAYGASASARTYDVTRTS